MSLFTYQAPWKYAHNGNYHSRQINHPACQIIPEGFTLRGLSANTYTNMLTPDNKPDQRTKQQDKLIQHGGVVTIGLQIASSQSSQTAGITHKLYAAQINRSL